MMDFEQLIKTMAPGTVANLRRVIELGRWPDGRGLTAEQRGSSLQAVIAWENLHLPDSERTGYLHQRCGSSKNHASTDDDQDDHTILRFRDA
ncbi:MAG: DUF1315 family protein [Endozoicomonadaceae bacterium]|nr:DUF1315 family protein [Endozoicomonadaceae bacterium]